MEFVKLYKCETTNVKCINCSSKKLCKNFEIMDTTNGKMSSVLENDEEMNNALIELFNIFDDCEGDLYG